MSRMLVLSIVVASLSTVVGCGARQSASAATPTNVTSAEARDEECWTPPTEIAMSIKDDAKPETTGANATEDKMKGSSFRPNRNDRPSTGAVHAAAY